MKHIPDASDVLRDFIAETVAATMKQTDNLIAAFMHQNPDVPVEDILLIQRINGDSVELRVERKKSMNKPLDVVRAPTSEQINEAFNSPYGAVASAMNASAERVKVLEEALIKLRDCDWVISLPDRMDAVRDIAREALQQAEGK